MCRRVTCSLCGKPSFAGCGAHVEQVLAQGDQRAGLAVLDAHRAGGTFAAWKRAFIERGAEPTGPRARVPSTAEIIALRRRPAPAA